MKLKNLTPILVILLFSIFSQNAFSQKKEKFILKFAPLSLLDPYGPNYHFGSEFFIKGRISIETDFAIYIPNYNKNDETPRIKDRNGFKIKPEIRFYFKQKDSAGTAYKGWYFADELFFIKDRFKQGDTFITQDHTEQYFDFEIIKRMEIGNNIKIGYQSIIKNKVIIDSYLGIGIKYIDSKYEYEITDDICCLLNRYFELPLGKGLKPNFTFGVKIGYII